MSSSIKLQSKDGVLFVVDVDVFMCSVMLKTMLDDFGMDDLDYVIPLKPINSDISLKVIDWATYYKGESAPLDGNEGVSSDLLSWDIEFFKVNPPILVGLISAANYLDIPALMSGACKTAANWIKGRTVQEMRKIFDTQSDLTPQEKKQKLIVSKVNESIIKYFQGFYVLQ